MNKGLYFEARQERKCDTINLYYGGRIETTKEPNCSGALNVADKKITYSKLKIGFSESAYTCECPAGSENEWAVTMDVNNSCSFKIADVIAGFSKLEMGSPDLAPCEECPPIGR